MTRTHMVEEMEVSYQSSLKNLAVLLADTTLLYIKTRNFHWNIVDPRFMFLHKLFEDQYEELAEAADVIAERIRSLDFKAPGTMKEFLELSSLEEAHGSKSGDDMIRDLANDHYTMTRYLSGMIDEALKDNDQGTSDLMIDRLRAHDKTAWILRSHLKK